MKKDRRLLHLIKTLDIGGIEKTTIQYSEELIKNFNLIGIYAKKGFYDKSEYLNSNIKRFVPPFNISNYLFFLINFVHLVYTIKQNKITHIHYHHRIFIPFIFLLRLFSPKLHVFYTHHSCFQDKLNRWIIADKIVVLNESTKDDLQKKQKVKATIIPHGVPFQNISLKKNTPRTIGFVGRYVQLKGIHNLLDEFRIIKSFVSDAQLNFYGKGPEENKMKEFVKKHSLSSSVTFFEPQIDLANIYKNIDLLVLPSTEIEGFGLVVLEALSYGIPVVVNNLGIYKNLVEHNYNGIIVNKSISDEIIAVINNIELFNKMRENASNSVKRKYKIENTIDSYRAVYNANENEEKIIVY